MALRPAGGIVDALRRRLGLDPALGIAIEIWEREFRPQVPYARLAGVKRGVFILEVESPVHFQELTVRRRELFERICQYLGPAPALRGIKIRLKTADQ